MIGYTEKQADRIRGQLARNMSRIEDAASAMLGQVTDHDESLENQLEDIRRVYHTLDHIVERRTR